MGFKPEELAIMLEEAKQYTDSQRIAYTEPNIFTFNGNPEGKPIAENVMVKISDKILDASTFSKASGFMNGQPLEANREDCRIEDYGEGRIIILMGTISIAMIINSTNSTYQKGLYVICVPEDNSYVSCIEFAETVHPIEPKYLPGVCLPVVELSEETFNALFSGATATLTELETATLTAAKEAVVPVVIKTDRNGSFLSVVAMLLNNQNGDVMYIAETYGFGKIVFTFTNDGITAQIGS